MIAVAVIAIVLVGLLLLTVFLCMRSTKEGFMTSVSCTNNPTIYTCVHEMINVAKHKGVEFKYNDLKNYVEKIVCNSKNSKDLPTCLQSALSKWNKDPSKIQDAQTYIKENSTCSDLKSCVNKMIRIAKEANERVDANRLEKYVRDIACRNQNTDCMKNLVGKWNDKSYRQMVYAKLNLNPPSPTARRTPGKRQN